MRKIVYVIAICLLLVSCGSSKRARTSQPLPESTAPVAVYIDEGSSIVDEISVDRTYAHKEANPIKVGGAFASGPSNQHAFLNALAGPNGEPISYKRTGSCCPFETKYSSMEVGFLDKYEVSYQGQATPMVLYLNMYDPGGKLRVPYGFTLKKSEQPAEVVVDDKEAGHNHDQAQEPKQDPAL